MEKLWKSPKITAFLGQIWSFLASKCPKTSENLTKNDPILRVGFARPLNSRSLLLAPKHLPKLDEALQAHHLEVVAGDEIEDRGQQPDAVQGIRAELVAEGQGRGLRVGLGRQDTQRTGGDHQ